MIMSTNKFYTLNQILYSCAGIMVCCWLVNPLNACAHYSGRSY